MRRQQQAHILLTCTEEQGVGLYGAYAAKSHPVYCMVKPEAHRLTPQSWVPLTSCCIHAASNCSLLLLLSLWLLLLFD
jgi:hypothetical protein